ncbi:enhancer of mRNA-decapping protein 4-like [Rhizophagus irregularis DAOM 181602=DAOM 197198]|uniref:Uncharacterized protein n=1 Tax=Rhizophagus irregularis (strain DAOM 181602 / DAOM 197198 / MUCL 43194) TaxID=747089 RepID=A0A2P4QGV9_RHIID|nr:hypothetical protein GLOIN_2v1552841 [Rhizophagus irregularis DAOM 181602=DAOM 197198]POG76846.1 hypothetical protein GLOIN_2v1552841 [Rhizophagus irregularis DAOM 181602=DAOM 197198]GBC42470.2 enhancer of mRNA-decapping protein 4-like [Rhizophagus irregularis DAOM 181602=DAOM 197198]|eukprot:XP_025183712.1 hypothetical protein GLOIN_2v1552841 [Rhizophagus irregularis DAOM 181602=DAOM 197198]
MDPSATLLSLLHKNQTSPPETNMTGQRSPTTPSYPSSQPTPPPIQSSPNIMPIYNYTPHFNTQPLAYNQNIFPPATVPPPPPPPPPPLQLSSQSQQMSPNSNPIVSLLETLNTSSSQTTSISVSGTPQPQSILNPVSGENEATTTTGTGDPTLFNIDKASTESLKLALFGRNSPATGFDISQQENENQYLADTSLPQNENPPAEEITYPEETSEIEAPAEETDYNNNNNNSSLESIRPTTSSPSTKQPPSTTNKSMFTYTNPFDLLKEPLSPSQSINTAQWSSQSTLTSQKNQEVSVVHKDSGVFSRPQQQKEPFLSELSAWNVRANSSSKALSSIPDGVKLPRGTLFYNTGKKNEIVLSSKELELTTITLVPSELEYRAGKSIAVNAFYICYAVKGGRIRVISTLYGSKTLLRNHDKSILDMCIQDVLSDELNEESKTQLLLAVGSDSKITVWELSEPPSEQAAEIPYKILLAINSNESIDESKSPRYHRAVWHPVNRNMFAVATDTNDVLVVDINKILEGTDEMNFKESDISEKILKLQMEDKPINDLAFSPDGTILATASDECVIFWALNFENDVGINPVHRIILDGQQVSSVLFIDGENISSGQSLLFKFRYVILGTERNTILHLYDVESSEYIQSINFLPPPERRPSLNKAYRKEEAMFNCVSFDQETSTLLIANSSRISIFALHLHLPHKKTEQLDLYNQNEHDTMGSVDDSTGPNVTQFDYMIEFPVNQLIGSFVIVPDTNSSQGISLYCIQSKAVQQYHIAKHLLLPPDLDACPEYVIEEVTLDPPQEEVEDTKKEEQNEVLTTETSELSSHSGGQLPTTDEGNIEKDIIKEVVTVEITNTVAEEHEPETTTVVTEDTSLSEKRVVQDSTTGIMVESTVNSDENESKSQESQKISSSIKLSGPVVNERTSRRKERRAMERDKDSGSENINNSPETTSRAAGKKTTDGISKNNGKIGAGEKTRKVTEEGHSSTSSPAAGISNAQMQTILKEIKKMEESVTNKLGKMFSKELEKQFQKIEEERIAHQAAETSRQETILKVVSQTLSNNTSKLLESTIRSEVQNSVLPTLSKMVTNAVDKHAHRGMVEAVNKNIPTAIDKAVSENVPRVLSKAPVIESIAKGVSKSIRPVIEETFRENFTSVLIPSYQKATNAMFEQITTTFEAGLQDIAHKSAQSASYASAYNIDQNTLARLQASIDHLTLNVQQLQASINNANVGGNIVRQVGLGKHVEQQQLGRSSEELQHQRARSLSGELKRILIPQSATSASTPSMSHQDTYNSYTPSGRVSSSQPHQIHQQQQFHQSRQQHQHQQHQHQQQLLSPVEPPGLEENLNSEIERHLEMGNYEDAFVIALASHDLPVILRLCSKVNPKSVFLPSRSLLTQAVILSLIHHLSLELNKFTELKRAWVEEAIIKLNPKDHEIRDHCERILPMVKQRLEEYYYQIASQDAQSPNLKNIGLLIHAVNGLLS